MGHEVKAEGNRQMAQMDDLGRCGQSGLERAWMGDVFISESVSDTELVKGVASGGTLSRGEPSGVAPSMMALFP